MHSLKREMSLRDRIIAGLVTGILFFATLNISMLAFHVGLNLAGLLAFICSAIGGLSFLVFLYKRRHRKEDGKAPKDL